MTANQFTRRRKKLFRTQAAAAEALGVTQQALSKWETGNNPIPLWLVKFLECLEEKQDTTRGLNFTNPYVTRG